jgi:hypothetical protein
MPEVTFNPMIAGVAGKTGRLVFRRRGAKIFADRAPEASSVEPTGQQLAQRDRFAAAQAYRREVLADPSQQRVYMALGKQLGRRYDKIVESDFLTPPEVEHIELADYHGRAGDVIRVIAIDDVEVVSVHVALTTGNGAVLEQGPAAKVHGVWVYTATTAKPEGEKLTITATAKDRPGHEAQLSAAVG